MIERRDFACGPSYSWGPTEVAPKCPKAARPPGRRRTCDHGAKHVGSKAGSGAERSKRTRFVVASGMALRWGHVQARHAPECRKPPAPGVGTDGGPDVRPALSGSGAAEPGGRYGPVMRVRIVSVVGIGVAGWVLLAAYGFGAFALGAVVAVLAGVAVAFTPRRA